MIDFTNFSKYKFIYLFIILTLVVIWAIKAGPLYEVFIDISVSPPENIRKTDFSWITVNQWFNSQTYIITSHSVLKGVKSDIEKDRLKKIVSAKRLGAADVIRISARSNDTTAELKKVVSDIANLYLKRLGEGDKEKKADEAITALPLTQDAKAKLKAGKIDAEKIRDDLRITSIQIEQEINAIQKRLENYETELKDLEAKPAKLGEIKERIAQIDRELYPLNIKLADLKSSYTDRWSAVSELKNKIDMLKKEKAELNRKLPAAQRNENAKIDIEAKIRKDKENIKKLQDELKAIDKSLIAYKTKKPTTIEKKDIPTKEKKGSAYGRIISPPTRKLLPELGMKFLIGCPFGFLIWFLIGRLLKNGYLIWLFIGRLFRRK